MIAALKMQERLFSEIEGDPQQQRPNSNSVTARRQQRQPFRAAAEREQHPDEVDNDPRDNPMVELMQRLHLRQIACAELKALRNSPNADWLGRAPPEVLLQVFKLCQLAPNLANFSRVNKVR